MLRLDDYETIKFGSLVSFTARYFLSVFTWKCFTLSTIVHFNRRNSLVYFAAYNVFCSFFVPQQENMPLIQEIRLTTPNTCVSVEALTGQLETVEPILCPSMH